jgi:hypothetical protein
LPSTGLVAASSLIGDPINCDKGKKVFEDHCWIHGAERAGYGDLEDQKHFGCVLRTNDKNEVRNIQAAGCNGGPLGTLVENKIEGTPILKLAMVKRLYRVSHSEVYKVNQL